MEYVVIDLETVPKTETVSTWVPKLVDGKEEFPPLHVHKICCIGYCILRDNPTESKPMVEYNSLFDYSFDNPKINNEEQIIQQYYDMVDQMDRFTLVTWNGRTFDLPVLIHRMYSYGMDLDWYYRNKEIAGRYSKQHIDVMDVFCNYGTFGHGRAHLDSIAKLSGLPGKGDVKGDNVKEMHEAGRYEEIQTYCITDVIQTAFIFLRFAALSGHLGLDFQLCIKMMNSLLDKCHADPRAPINNLYHKSDLNKLLMRD